MTVPVELWTDGSGLADGGPGGWAYVLRAVRANGTVLSQREASGGLEWATNQRAELEAVINGLVTLDIPGTHVTVFTDSEYVMHGFTKGWVERWQQNGWVTRDHEPVQNRDLWETLAQGVAAHRVTWWHVKGHAKTWECSSPRCAWHGDDPIRRTPKARIRYCRSCEANETPSRCVARDKYPLNVRCDELAGAQRRRLLQATEQREAVPA